ncbi:DeoR/GlpR transcriptional regulator [Paenibacillus polymyxa]|uniref:DeoR/GlpR family DNA-binding transcription regulator n=1 Tax=Paenibacillus polymyxa TaxID=1406 RepID=UPI0010BE2993|nr:DeoR/GlpR transcriptional regulator [Paenibacillus polymyxa]
MHQEERLLKILEYLQSRNQLSNSEICDLLNISRDTARRDIIKLVHEGGVIRTHGGIALPLLKEEIRAYKERVTSATKQKMLIAKAASEYIADGDVCFMDVSTTIQLLCGQLDKNLTVYTHSLDNAEALSAKSEININLIGGKFNHENRFFYDYDTAMQLNDVFFDKAFLGAAAIMEDGVYFANRDDALVKKLVSRRAREVFLLADFKKFNLTSPFKGLNFSEIDILITNQDAPKHSLLMLQDSGVEVIKVLEEEK